MRTKANRTVACVFVVTMVITAHFEPKSHLQEMIFESLRLEESLGNKKVVAL